MSGAITQTVAEPYLPVEEVARRLDLPLGILLRRVEAGDVPARRVEGPDGVHYSLRLSDLGVEPDRMPAANGSQEPAPAGPHEPEAPAERPDQGPVAVAEPVAATEEPIAEAAAPDHVSVIGTAAPRAWPDKVVPPPAEELAHESHLRLHVDAAQRPQPVNPPAPAAPAAPAAPPPGSTLAPAGTRHVEPRSEVAAMMLDPRELVAGLLDRWERTLEQRIYAEQRQRFEAELNARQNLVKQLQLELQTARAEHAAAQAERDRRLAERERQLADAQRELADSRQAANRRRRWFK
jgi:hypothetical protein